MPSVAPKLRVPRQQRSRETLKRILDAFEAALENQTFEEVTVGELCERAECSVGTFYGRVESKDALLEHLRQRVYGNVAKQLRDLFDPRKAEGADLESVIDEQSEVLLDFHLQRRGVIRAVILQARRHPVFAKQTQVFNASVLSMARESWLMHRDEIVAPDPVLATEQAALMIAGYLREAVVFRELWPTQRQLDRAALLQQTRSVLVRFLMGRAPRGETT